MAPKETSPSGYGTIPSSSTAPSAPPPPSPTNVQVIAPATLQAGYTFDAMYDGVTFTVTVPEGGVVKGQRFIVPFVPPAGQDAPPTATAVGEPLSSANTGSGGGGGGGGSTIPTGVWRDSLCDCLRFGPCHPHFLNAWFCRLVLLGQILTRMKMTWLGFRTRGNPDDRRWKSTFSIMVKLTIAYYVLDILTSPADPETGDDDVNVTLNSVIGAVTFFYTTYVLIQLRATLRHVYSIPEESCLCLYEMGLCGNNPREGICGSGGGGGDDDGSSSTRLCTSGVAVGWEDVCCAFWCPLCVAGQMARHTVDYEQRGRRAVCCNEVGVENWEEDDAYEGVVRVGEGSVLVV